MAEPRSVRTAVCDGLASLDYSITVTDGVPYVGGYALRDLIQPDAVREDAADWVASVGGIDRAKELFELGRAASCGTDAACPAADGGAFSEDREAAAGAVVLSLAFDRETGAVFLCGENISLRVGRDAS